MFGRKKGFEEIWIDCVPDGERIRVVDMRFKVPHQTHLWETRLGKHIKYEFECRHCHGLVFAATDPKEYFKVGKENIKKHIFDKTATREYIVCVGLCISCLDREMTR